MAPTPPSRLLLCPMCTFPNRLTADAMEMHLAMRHYPGCLPYPCITGCLGTLRFSTEAALRRHSREEHRLTNYEVSFQPRNEDERFQVGRIRAQLRSALAESNQNDSDDGERDVKFLEAMKATTATNTAMGGMNEAGGSIPASTSTSASPRMMAPPPLEASAATSAASNIAPEANATACASGQPRSNSSGAPSSSAQCITQQSQPPIENALSARCTCGALLRISSKRNLAISKMRHVNSHLKIPLHECRLCSTTFNGYNRGDLYKHLRRSHPHLKGAPIHKLERHCISHRSEANTERLRRAVKHYFPTANRT